MAHSYCSGCDAELDYPEVREIAEQQRTCPICGDVGDPKVSIAELLVQLHERVADLEAQAGSK